MKNYCSSKTLLREQKSKPQRGRMCLQYMYQTTDIYQEYTHTHTHIHIKYTYRGMGRGEMGQLGEEARYNLWQVKEESLGFWSKPMPSTVENSTPFEKYIQTLQYKKINKKKLDNN